MSVPTIKCICDADIWVNVCLGDAHKAYIKKFSTIGIVDTVKNEIMRWERNEERFRKVFTVFTDYENKGLTILDGNSVDPNTKKIIDLELVQWGFKDTDNSSEPIANLGEFVSLLYAYHMEIPYIHTGDMTFGDTIGMDELFLQYKEIEVITWNQVSGSITSSDSERLALNQKVNNENEIMGIRRKEAKQQEDMNKMLLKFKNQFSNRL